MELFKHNNQEIKNLLDGGKVRLIHTQNLTLAEWEFDEGSDLPEHSHPHEQITKVISGRFALTVEGVTYTLEEGDSIIINPNELHSGKSLTKSKLIDVFHPAREDLK